MTKREEYLINDCIFNMIPQNEFEMALEQGKSDRFAVKAALKPFEIKAIAKIEEHLKELKEELNA